MRMLTKIPTATKKRFRQIKPRSDLSFGSQSDKGLHHLLFPLIFLAHTLHSLYYATCYKVDLLILNAARPWLPNRNFSIVSGYKILIYTVLHL